MIEVLIAMSLLVFMMSSAWYTVSGTQRAKMRFEEIQERNHELRVAMARLAKDISSAYISKNEDQNLQERRTLFKGRSHGSVHELRFSSLGHVSLWADANESEQTLISYSAEPDLEDPNITTLVRRESRRLSNEPWKREPAEMDVLLRGIVKLEFEYWDWRSDEWKDDWDTTRADGQKGRLPTRVRIKLEAKTRLDGDNTIKLQTQARIMMQEELQFFAN